MLTGAMFMLEIYDRVLPSRSVPTLIGIAILAGGLLDCGLQFQREPPVRVPWGGQGQAP